VDNPTYSGALSFLRPIGCKLNGVRSDENGLVPEELERLLESLPKQGKHKPRVLYTVPIGQNPTGFSLSADRRKKVYDIACKHDLIILEDDPYYYLYYGSNPAPVAGRDDTYQRPMIASLWSLDTQGRVIRFDSFSKVLSSGLRIGFVSGPSAFVDQINLNSQATNLHTSGVSQILAFKYLQHIGEEGWKKHTNAVALFYSRKRDACIALLNKHLAGLVTWKMPTAGMFVWLKIEGVQDTKALIEQKAKEAKVVLVPGQVFLPVQQQVQFRSCFFFACFSGGDGHSFRKVSQAARGRANPTTSRFIIVTHFEPMTK